MDILKEDDFDGILWDNDDVDDKVNIASEMNNKKDEVEKHGERSTVPSIQNDPQSRLIHGDPGTTLPLASSTLDLQSQRTFAPIDMEDTLEHPFLNSFVSTLAEKSSSQDAPSNVLNASTGLPIFPSISSSNNGTHTSLNGSHHLNLLPASQPRASSVVSTNECEFPPNHFNSWESGQSSSQDKASCAVVNKNAASLLSQQFQQVEKKTSQIQRDGNKWNVILGDDLPCVNNLANVAASTVRDTSSRSGSSNTRVHSSQSQRNHVIQNAQKKSKTKSTGSRKSKHSVTNEKAQVPPFFLFDAPVELRHNFMKAQQALSLPTSIQDSNSFHYGLAMNSFQSVIKYKDNKVKSLTMLNSVDDIVNPHGKKVELLDARQKNNKKGNDRNEREQQRAQKITELIDKLRLTMVQNGWKVEMKSKYQILSTCSEYLNHLKSITKEKEEKLEKTKADIALREQKLKEDQGLQDSRSDPESVTSSLTNFSTSSGNFVTNVSDDAKKSDQGKPNPEQSAPSAPSTTPETSSDPPTKKSSTDDGSGSSSDSGPKGAHIAVNKMSSSVSDMTDSNKGSSDGKTSTETDLKPSLVTSSEGCSQRHCEEEVSSTAAVVSGIGSQEHGHTHADVVIKTAQRKRKRQHEPTSLDEDFVLNYQEVFMTSNVPQIISTLAGRIIISNDCFYSITGLSHQQMKRITLFSLIQAEKLSKLYELVAESLTESKKIPDDSEGRSSSNNDKKCFKTITLPCIQFPPRNNCQFSLYMNVCFIWNENPIKRCFHCAFYDKINEKENDGFVSSTMLGSLDL